MYVSSEQPECGWVGVTRRSPVHSEALCASVGRDGKCGRVRTIFFVGKAGHVERLEERAYVPYVDLSCFSPSGDEVGLRDGGQGCRCRERLSPDAVNTAEMGNGSELEERVLIQRIPIVFIIII